MDKIPNIGEYLAPKIMVIELENLEGFCLAVSSTEEFNDGNTNGWFD